ncbi:MAG: transposase [Deltaproteobacteria bacterium]|nr:transposase [Deltaproteobacteria bacterium]
MYEFLHYVRNSGEGKHRQTTMLRMFLNTWITKIIRSKIEPMKHMARQIRHLQPLIFNWLTAKKLFSSGIVEGFNNKAKVTLKKAYGFHTLNAVQIALFQQLGALPEHLLTHTFW